MRGIIKSALHNGHLRCAVSRTLSHSNGAGLQIFRRTQLCAFIGSADVVSCN